MVHTKANFFLFEGIILFGSLELEGEKAAKSTVAVWM